ncbi:MAG: four helix bundle protein [Fidelibacterota bacterium]
MLNERKNEMLEQTFESSLEIIELTRYLKLKKEFIMSNQLLKCGTSIGANVSEAQAAQTGKDFVAKMAIAAKEAREAEYWIRLLDKSNILGKYQHKLLLYEKINSIIKMLTSIVKTAQERNN